MQLLIMIWLIIILSSKIRQKAGGHNAVPHTKIRRKKPALFKKALKIIFAKYGSPFEVKFIKNPVKAPSFDVIKRDVSSMTSFSFSVESVFLFQLNSKADNVLSSIVYWQTWWVSFKRTWDNVTSV